MGLITRAMAKRLAANNGGSEIAELRRTVADEKDSAVNVDMERDVNESCISANDRGAESSEVLKAKIHTESDPIATHASPSTDPKSGTTERRRGTKVTRATRPRRIRQPTKRKGGSSRETSAPDVSGKISPDHSDAKNNNGTSEGTSIVTIGRKRGREETSDVDLQTGDVVSKRAKTRRIYRDIRRSPSVSEAPSDARKLVNCTNSSLRVMTNGVHKLPGNQCGAERRSDETPSVSGVPGSIVVCSGQFQEEKENAPADHLTSSPLQRSRRKGTCSGTEFILARAMLALSKPRIFSGLRDNSGPDGERNETHFPHELPLKSFLSIEHNDGATALPLPDLLNEAVQAPTWKAPRLDPDDFAFLIRRATPYRFKESNMRNEALTRPTREE